MHEVDGQEVQTEGVRGVEGQQDLRNDAYGSETVERASEGVRHQSITSDRKSSKEGTTNKSATGGILAQLLEDAEKQLIKSRECIVWYREEAKEYEQKIENLRKLMELQESEQQALESNDTEGASPE